MRVSAMFDFAVSRPFDVESPDMIDGNVLAQALDALSDDELARLEDDLDFCNFAGVPSDRILRMLSCMIELDDGWRQQLMAHASPALPVAY